MSTLKGGYAAKILLLAVFTSLFALLEVIVQSAPSEQIIIFVLVIVAFLSACCGIALLNSGKKGD